MVEHEIIMNTLSTPNDSCPNQAVWNKSFHIYYFCTITFFFFWQMINHSLNDCLKHWVGHSIPYLWHIFINICIYDNKDLSMFVPKKKSMEGLGSNAFKKLLFLYQHWAMCNSHNHAQLYFRSIIWWWVFTLYRVDVLQSIQGDLPATRDIVDPSTRIIRKQ